MEASRGAIRHGGWLRRGFDCEFRDGNRDGCKIETEPDRTNLENLPRNDITRNHRLMVDVSSVRGTEVFHLDANIGDFQFTVKAGDGRIGNPKIIGGISANAIQSRI
jgi:hypothetical protein